MEAGAKKEKDSENRLIVVLLLVITVAAVCIAFWAVSFRMPDVILVPDYAPKETEAHAEVIPSDSGAQSGSETDGGSVTLTYSDQVSIDLSEERASLVFINPGKSNQNMLLQIVIQKEVVVQSGIILPGRQVRVLDLLDGAAEKLAPGGYDGCFSIYYYHPETGEKAMINTEIPIRIEVRK